MQLEAYFDFISDDDIRIKGHRLGIDNVIHYHLQGCSPQAILEHFPSLNLEMIYATLTYYYHNQDEVDAYLKRIQDWKKQRYQESLRHPSPMRQRVQQIQAERSALKEQG